MVSSKLLNRKAHRATLKRYFLEEQGWDEHVVHSTPISELEQLYEEFNQ